MTKTYEIPSARLTVANGTCSLCGTESVGTLDFGSEEQTFFCAKCATLEYEEAVAKKSSEKDVDYCC